MFRSILPAQTDSTFALPQVTIRDAPGLPTGFSTWKSDVLPQSGVRSLAERLQWETPVSLRVNGPGTLSTASIRGAGPSRVAVFWQGLNLQSTMNGVTDLALLPLWPNDLIEVQYGGQSAAQSAGAMGGAIFLHPNFPNDSTGWHTQLGLANGSFSRWDAQVGVDLNRKKLQSHLRSAYHRASNNFPFKNTALIGAPESRQVNNTAEKFDLQQYNTLKINAKNKLETAIWLQRAFREIPPAMTEAAVLSWQNDQALRAIATWKTTPNNHSQWKHSLAWQEEFIAFNLRSDIDTSRAQTIRLNTEYWIAPDQRLSLRANLQAWYQRAQADGYADSSQWFQQKRLAAAIQGAYFWRRLQLSAQLRQEWAEGQGTPFTWTLGSRWNFTQSLFVQVHLSRNFNLPTFNDRFWRQLGNPDLQPESGYSSDIGLHWNQGNWSVEATAFNLLVDNWILWQPGTDGQFRPDNLRRVWSRGLEFSSDWKFRFLKSQWKLHSRYQLVRATNTAVYQGNTSSLYKVLPYTPQHTASAGLRWSKSVWSAAYLHQWSGARFTNSDNSDALPAFHTGNLLVQYALNWTRQRMIFQANLENCWNANYQFIAYRPLPGRSWRLGIQWEF